MRIPIQTVAEGSLAAASVLIALALDALLLRVFWSNLREMLVFRRYRPVYLRSGRRNRVRH